MYHLQYLKMLDTKNTALKKKIKTKSPEQKGSIRIKYKTNGNKIRPLGLEKIIIIVK